MIHTSEQVHELRGRLSALGASGRHVDLRDVLAVVTMVFGAPERPIGIPERFPHTDSELLPDHYVHRDDLFRVASWLEFCARSTRPPERDSMLNVSAWLRRVAASATPLTHPSDPADSSGPSDLNRLAP